MNGWMDGWTLTVGCNLCPHEDALLHRFAHEFLFSLTRTEGGGKHENEKGRGREGKKKKKSEKKRREKVPSEDGWN